MGTAKLTYAFLALVLLVSVNGMSLKTADGRELQFRATIKHDSAQLKLGERHEVTLKLSKGLPEPRYCVDSGADVCIDWGLGKTKLTVRRSQTEPERHVLHVQSQEPVELCYDLHGEHLYGGNLVFAYPQENVDVQNFPFYTGDFTRIGAVQAVMERYWYLSNGVNLKVDEEANLFVTQNQRQLCLAIDNSFPYKEETPLSISYETCLEAKNLREGLACFYKNYDNKPTPPKEMISKPIWSTWVEFERDINQDKILKFYDDIKKNNFKISVMEVDDAWETCYGTQVFDSAKFSDVKGMVDHFKDEGVLTTLWVHPFLGPGCDKIDTTQYEPYLWKMSNGSIGYTEWWNGKGAKLYNMNDENTRNWFINRLKKIQEQYGFYSFKFDAGEAAYIPGLSLAEKMETVHKPNEFTKNYVKMASSFGPSAEIRVGADAASYPIMQRLQDTNSVWETNFHHVGGLQSVIKSALQLSLHGYGAILPDMVGGNAYEGKTASAELFIRWTQVNALMPLMQFSTVPWNYDQQTVDIVRKAVDLHYQYTDKIMEAFANPNAPVLNPVWWIAPEDKTALTISDEFLLGETILVAPVVEEGAKTRNIYLPAGKWTDVQRGDVIQGPKWLKNYPAPLDYLPFFEKTA